MDNHLIKNNDDQWSHGEGCEWNPWLMIQNDWEIAEYYALMVGEGLDMTHGLVDD